MDSIHTVVVGFAAGFMLFAIINYVLAGNTWNFATNTYGFMFVVLKKTKKGKRRRELIIVFRLNYEDLKPNCGLFWYFYSQVY